MAQRAAGAAKDTATLIEGSIEKAKNGSEIAGKVADALQSIMDNSKKVADIISEIAAASKEQAEGIGQVANAVGQMDQVTQQNASASEECASSAEELSSQADALKGMVVELRQIVHGGDAGAVPVARQISGPERRSGARLTTTVKSPKRKAEGARVISPEEVFPLDDDSFKDF